MCVAQVEIAERSNRDVKLNRVHPHPKHPARNAANENLSNPLNQRMMHLMQPLALDQMSGAMKVLTVHEMDELGMFLEITPSEINQSLLLKLDASGNQSTKTS